MTCKKFANHEAKACVDQILPDCRIVCVKNATLATNFFDEMGTPQGEDFKP
ncbi:MAG: hypothetical protein WB821_11695 [Burkholderiaceae bacterium]